MSLELLCFKINEKHLRDLKYLDKLKRKEIYNLSLSKTNDFIIMKNLYNKMFDTLLLNQAIKNSIKKNLLKINISS